MVEEKKCIGESKHPSLHVDEVSPQLVIRCDTSIDTYRRVFAFCRKFLFLDPSESGQVHMRVIVAGEVKGKCAPIGLCPGTHVVIEEVTCAKRSRDHDKR
jgi:hypothetical protein